MLIGYARVSTNDQDTTAQASALKAAGCERIFRERAKPIQSLGRPKDPLCIAPHGAGKRFGEDTPAATSADAEESLRRKQDPNRELP